MIARFKRMIDRCGSRRGSREKWRGCIIITIYHANTQSRVPQYLRYRRAYASGSLGLSWPLLRAYTNGRRAPVTSHPRAASERKRAEGNTRSHQKLAHIAAFDKQIARNLPRYLLPTNVLGLCSINKTVGLHSRALCSPRILAGVRTPANANETIDDGHSYVMYVSPSDTSDPDEESDLYPVLP